MTRCTDIFLGWTFTITLWILFTFFFLGILCSQVNFEVFSTLFCEPSCSFLMDESSNFKQWGTFSENLHVWKCYLLPSYCIMAVYSISWIYFLIFSMTMFWNMIIWDGVGLFSFIVLMGTLSLGDYFLLGNSGKFSHTMSFITSFLHFFLCALSENIICMLNLLDQSLNLIILSICVFSSWLLFQWCH